MHVFTTHMDRLSNVLPKVLRRRGLAEHATGALVVYKARQWLREKFPAFADQVDAKNVRENVLMVECKHSIALQEVKNAETDLIGYLSQECPMAGIREIRTVRT